MGHHLGPAAGAEAGRRRAVGSGHRAEGHAGGRSAEAGGCQVLLVREENFYFSPTVTCCVISKPLSSLGVDARNVVVNDEIFREIETARKMLTFPNRNSVVINEVGGTKSSTLCPCSGQQRLAARRLPIKRKRASCRVSFRAAL